jgi:hypothetical protein
MQLSLRSISAMLAGVLAAGWNKVEATQALIRYKAGLNHPKMMGHLFTTWSGRKQWTEFPPLVEGLKLLKASD